jgi:hypothetical protein
MATATTVTPPAIHPGLAAGQMLARAAGREPGASPEQESELARLGRNSAEAALLPSADRDQPPGQLVLSAPLARMPVELDVAIPIPDFRVRNLLALATGQIIESAWGHGEDVPLSSGAVQLAWSEFEVIESQLAVRITRLG